MAHFDLILRHGTVYDGLGNEGLTADVGLAGDEIVAVGDLSAAEGATVDCTGLAVAPGFVDAHNHSDLTLLVNPEAESMIRQGVTTLVTGQCGFTPFPVRPGHERELDELCPFIAAEVPWTWHSTADFRQRVREARPAVNVAAMVGHSALRAYVYGFAQGDPSPEQIAEMVRLLEVAFDEGAVGLSFGLGYALGAFASTDEMRELCRVAARRGRHVSFHIRNEGVRLLESLTEAIGLARDVASDGVLRVQIDHLKASGQRAWGKMSEALALIEAARAEGLDVAFDMYPYIAGSRHLCGSLPGWATEGGHGAMMARLKDPEGRLRLREEQDAWDRGEIPVAFLDIPPESVLITDVVTEANRWTIGKRLSEIGAAWGKDALDTALDLLIAEDAYVNACFFSMREEDMRLALAHPAGCIGTDGLVFAPYGALSRGAPHPRSYGTYPRVLGKYVREESLLTLPEAIRKCTSFPASRLGMADRGRIAPGLKADVAVFDPFVVRDKATFAAPHQYPTGVEMVIINGQIAVRGEEHTGLGAGRLL